MGVELRDDEHGRAVRALYVHGFMIKNRADLVKMIEITKDAINRSTLENLLAHADAAGIGDDEARFLNYFGRTEDRRGAWARWLEHEKGTSGATRLCRLLREQRLAKYYVRSSRVLAHGKDNWETQQLEAVACQLAGVGGGHGLNQAHAGPWRYAAGDGRRDDTVIVFLATLCAREWGDRPLREARFHRAKTYNNDDARRAHTYRRRAPRRPTKHNDPRRLSTPSRRPGAASGRAAPRPRTASSRARSRPARSARARMCWRRRRARSSRRSAATGGPRSPRSRRDSPASTSTA